jgi:hypothetical protein
MPGVRGGAPTRAQIDWSRYEELEALPALTEPQRLRMVGTLDQLAAEMEARRG